MSKKPSHPRLPALLMVIIGLAFIAVAIIAFISLSRPPAPAATPTSLVEDPLLAIPRVSLADAKAAYDSKTAVFVDVRGSVAYQENHIPGALDIDLADLPNRLNQLNPQDWIITYCT